MIGRVVAILCPRKPLKPCARSVTCDAPEVHSYSLVHRLRLTVCLRMKCCTKTERDTGKLEEISPNVACEHRVPITDN